MRILPLIVALSLAGCGGLTDGFGGAVAKGTAPLAVVDLVNGTVEYQAAVDDLALYRDERMVFRRVAHGDGEVFVAVCEVTQAQWERLANTKPWEAVDPAICATSARAAGKPAFNITHADALLATVSVRLPDGARLDLPTADEWAAACVEGGEVVARETVISVDRLDIGAGMDTGGPNVVGSVAPNRLGLYDMLGNVWEWTREGESVRGGSWHDAQGMCQRDLRADSSAGTDDDAHVLIGLRLVLRP
jgi:formylglycine-generating enzyme required for sulfatase activity